MRSRGICIFFHCLATAHHVTRSLRKETGPFGCRIALRPVQCVRAAAIIRATPGGLSPVAVRNLYPRVFRPRTLPRLQPVARCR